MAVGLLLLYDCLRTGRTKHGVWM